MIYEKGLFHHWVPTPLRTVLSILLLLPILSASGVYTANNVLMYSGMGILSEDVSYINNASTLGMVLGFGFVYKAKARFTVKQILITIYLTYALLSFAMAHTENVHIILVSNFIIGFAKFLGIIMLLPPIMTILAPSGDRGKFYSSYYPLLLGAALITGYITASFAYYTTWHHVYLLATFILLLSALATIIFIHNKRDTRKTPMSSIDWKNILLFAVTLATLNYVLVYSKQQGWFASKNIQIAFVVFLVSLVFFIYRDINRVNPYINISILRKKNIRISLVYVFLSGMFLATAVLQTSYFYLVLKYDTVTISVLNLALLPGEIIGGLVSYQWFKKGNNWGLQWLIFGAFFCFLISVWLMYVLISPVIPIELIMIPQFFKGMGLVMMYVGGGYYFVNKITYSEFMSALPLLILFRSFLGTAFFVSIFSWALYFLQIESISHLAGLIDATSITEIDRGGGVGIFSAVQIQGLLSAIKQLYGYIAIATVLTLVAIIFTPFKKTPHRKLVFLINRVKGKKAKAKKKKQKESEEDGELETAASAAI